MSKDTSWDILKYKNPKEPNFYWELKLKFMEMNKDKIPENKLVCLAQALANSEFLGCKYPSSIMELVNELSRDMIEDFRDRRRGFLKRTLVSVSDAAKSKVNRVCRDNRTDGRTRLQIEELLVGYRRFVLAKSPEPTDVDNCINTINLNKETEDREPEAKKTVRLLEKGPQTNSDIVTPAVAIKSFANQHKGNLSEKFTKSVVSTSSSVVENSNKDLSNVQAKSNTDPATDFVFLKLAYSEPDTGWTLLQRSGSFCGVQMELSQRSYLDQASFSVLMNGRVISHATSVSRKDAREAAIDEAIAILKKKCHTVVVKTQFLTDGSIIGRDDIKKASDQKLDSENVGHKLLQMMGWTGGGLGRNQDGIAEPIMHKTVYRREGLGCGSNIKEFSAKIGKILQNFKKCQSAVDLVFSSGFSNVERQQVHRIARRYGLKSKSFGTGDDRFVTVSFKITGREIIEQLMQNGGCSDKYELLPPEASS